MKTTILILLFASLQLSAQFTLFTPDNSDLPSTNITDMVVDYGNRLWIATDTGLVVLQNNSWNTFNTDNSTLRENKVKDLYLDNSGNLYVLNQNAVFIYENNSFDVFLDNISASTIAVDNQQRVLLNTSFNLVRHYSNKIDTLAKRPDFNAYQIDDIEVDKLNNIYFKKEYENVLEIVTNEDKWLKFDYTHTVRKIHSLEDIIVDSNNNLWVSSVKKLFFYNVKDTVVKIYNQEDSDVFERTIIFRKIAVNSDNIPFSVGSFFLPQRAFLIFIYNDKVYTYPILDYFDSEGFQMDINAMAIDLNNNVWIHINNVGLLKFDPSQSSVRELPATDYTIYPNPATNQINVDLDGGLLASHYKVINTDGRVVLSAMGGFASTQMIDVQILPVGAYIIELTTTTGELIRDRFVKR